jgi:predicted DNA-binding protein
MATKTIRFNAELEEMLNYLIDQHGGTTSSVIKRAIRELYEYSKDMEIIVDFEKREEQGKTKYYTSDDIYALYDKHK